MDCLHLNSSRNRPFAGEKFITKPRHYNRDLRRHRVFLTVLLLPIAIASSGAAFALPSNTSFDNFEWVLLRQKSQGSAVDVRWVSWDSYDGDGHSILLDNLSVPVSTEGRNTFPLAAISTRAGGTLEGLSIRFSVKNLLKTTYDEVLVQISVDSPNRFIVASLNDLAPSGSTEWNVADVTSSPTARFFWGGETFLGWDSVVAGHESVRVVGVDLVAGPDAFKVEGKTRILVDDFQVNAARLSSPSDANWRFVSL